MDGMIPNIDELIANLKHQITLYRQMIDVVRDEREHVVQVHLKELRESTYSKEAIIDEIQREEHRRLEWLDAAAKILQIPAKELTIEIVANRMAREHFEILLNLKNTLLVLVKKAREMNAENKKLVEIALNDANEMKKNILGLTTNQPQVYGPKGSMGQMKDSSARILNKEA